MKWRWRWAWVLNVLLPGSGLIIARREWLGVVLGMLYVVCGQIVLVGLLIAPQALAGLWVAIAAGGLGTCWLGAQMLLSRRLRVVSDASIPSQIAMCYRLSDEALDRGRTEGCDWGIECSTDGG